MFRSDLEPATGTGLQQPVTYRVGVFSPKVCKSVFQSVFAMKPKPFGRSQKIGFQKMKETLEFWSYSRQCA